MEGLTDLGRFTPLHQRGKKGDHALVIMFQLFKGKWVQALGCFLSKGNATGTVLHQLVIESVTLAGRAGLKVDAVTTNGASWNRNMWKTFGVTEENVSVPHIVDPNRSLWFISDFLHLIKCMRNFFTHPERDKDAGIWTPDGIVSLKHWYALLNIEKEDVFQLKFFGVADAMELFKVNYSDLADCQPSINVCRRVKSLITAMNCRTPINNLTPGNKMWKIIDNFIDYLHKWEEGAKIRKCDFLTDSTSYELQISLRATLEICKFLVEECEYSYLMTARLNPR